jgi:hypothetical protein
MATPHAARIPAQRRQSTQQGRFVAPDVPDRAHGYHERRDDEDK